MVLPIIRIYQNPFTSCLGDVMKRCNDILDESGTDEAGCSMKVASGRRVAGAIRDARDLQLECASLV